MVLMHGCMTLVNVNITIFSIDAIIPLDFVRNLAATMMIYSFKREKIFQTEDRARYRTDAFGQWGICQIVTCQYDKAAAVT